MAPDPTQSASRPAWPLCVAVLAAVVYLNAVPLGFALDDLPIVRDNPTIRSAGSIPALLFEPYWPGMPETGLYRPVTSISFALNRAITGPGPAGYHAVNLLLHALVSALVWYVARGVRVHRPPLPQQQQGQTLHDRHGEPQWVLRGIRIESLAGGTVTQRVIGHPPDTAHDHVR